MNPVIIRKGKMKDVNSVFELGKKTEELSFSKHMTFHEKRSIILTTFSW
jgi:hypothetical protein